MIIFISIILLVIPLVLLLIYTALKLVRTDSDLIFYILSGVVSLVGINVKYGITLYLSRFFIILLLVGLLIKLLLRGSTFHPYINKTATIFGTLFLLILFQHFVSSIISERALDSVRQVFIYTFVMILFIIIVNIDLEVATIIKGLKIFLAVGLFQGLYGIYQVIGGPFSWPTYQSIMYFLPTAGDKTVNGHLFSGSYKLFRATGFLPGDVSHYATYIASIITLTVTFLINDRRSMYLKTVLFISFVALMLSLSRTGLLSLLIFGLPSLFVLTLKLKVVSIKFYTTVFKYSCGLIIIFIFIGPILTEFWSVDISRYTEVIGRRMADLVRVGIDKEGSMHIHIYSKLMALDALSLNPFFGVGLGVNASPWFSEAYNLGWAGSHSHHLDILGQTGLSGAMLEWFFMYMVGHYIWRGVHIKQAPINERLILAGLFASFILIIFGNFLYHFFLNDYVWYLLAVGVALSRAMHLKYNKTRISS